MASDLKAKAREIVRSSPVLLNFFPDFRIDESALVDAIAAALAEARREGLEEAAMVAAKEECGACRANRDGCSAAIRKLMEPGHG